MAMAALPPIPIARASVTPLASASMTLVSDAVKVTAVPPSPWTVTPVPRVLTMPANTVEAIVLIVRTPAAEPATAMTPTAAAALAATTVASIVAPDVAVPVSLPPTLALDALRWAEMREPPPVPSRSQRVASPKSSVRSGRVLERAIDDPRNR
jgi:hypothetical protein